MKLLYEVQFVKIDKFLALSTFDLNDLGEINENNYREASYEKYKLWELSKTAILAALEEVVLPTELSLHQLDTIKYYYIQVCHLLNGGKKLLDLKKPNIIILTQGSTPMARAILELARERAINIVAKEGAFLQGYIFLDNLTGMIINRHSASRQAGDWIYSRKFEEHDKELFREKMRIAQNSKRPEHNTGVINDSGENIYSILRLRENEKVAVFIGQVLTDASIIMDSPCFPDPVILIHKISEWFSKKEGWRLIIRLHPKESDGYSWISSSQETLGLPPHFTVIEQLPYNNITSRKLKETGFQNLYPDVQILEGRSVNTQELMQKADLGIAINSQAGFEMVLKGKRVVTCGDAFYARKGFTYDVSHPSALEQILEVACQNTNLSDEELCRAEQFGAHLFESVLLPRKQTSKSLKRIINILDGGKFLSPTRRLLVEKAALALEKQ